MDKFHPRPSNSRMADSHAKIREAPSGHFSDGENVHVPLYTIDYIEEKGMKK